jgi:hypothetical protein
MSSDDSLFLYPFGFGVRRSLNIFFSPLLDEVGRGVFEVQASSLSLTLNLKVLLLLFIVVKARYVLAVHPEVFEM